MGAAQAQELGLANHLFKITSYIEAAELFEKEKFKTQDIYEKLGDCYYFNSHMDEAAKWYGELMLFHESSVDPSYFFKYAQALKGLEKYEEASPWLKKYETIIKNGKINDVIKLDSLLNENRESIYDVFTLGGNTAETDFGGSFYNNTLVFSSSRSGGKIYDWNKQPYLDLYQANIDSEGNLEEIKPFSSKINTKLHESNAVFTKDGNTMYFTRNNLINGKKVKDKNKVTHLKIFRAELINDEWENISELPFNGDNYSIVHPALSEDDKKLYFSSDMPGTIGSFDIFVVNIDGKDNYSKPKNLGPKINTKHLEQFPFYSKDTLYYSSNGLVGFGGLDVFKSYNNVKQGFTTPKNLKLGINSSLDDFGYVLDEEKSAGYISSNRIGGRGGDDIYKFRKATAIFRIDGKVKDRLKLDPVEGASISLLDADKKVLETLKSDKDGEFSFILEPEKDYTIKVKHKSYIPTTYNFKTSKTDPVISSTILLDLYQTIDPDIVFKNKKVQIDHEPIYFDFNSSILTPKAKVILDDVVRVINKYPEINIHCGSHTDSRGSDKYNKWLSLRRAKSTADYIISKGISASRITSNGYGESELVNQCADKVKCTEEEHQLNRRSEFVLE